MDKNSLNKFHIYLGTVRGALVNTQCNSDVKTKYDLKNLGSEVTALEWGESTNDILMGHKDGSVKLYNTVQECSSNLKYDLKGEGPVVGIGCFGTKIIIGKHSGVVNIQDSDVNNSFSLNLNDSSTMECMKLNSYRKLIATGGEKNDLKLWDVETQEATFKAKSLGHDELNLPIPTTVRDICFFPTEEQLTACATKEGHVLLYDERAQRKPISKFFETKASYSAMATAYRERQCLVGTTKGYLQLIDLRQNKCIKTFKSFTGGITGIVCDPTEPFVASTCLDRHIRIHNLNTKELVHKEYMKIGLTKLIMKPIVKEEKPDEEGGKNLDEEYEDLFDRMETIQESENTGKKRKSAINVHIKKKIKHNKS